MTILPDSSLKLYHVALPELKARFAELGYETVGGTPAQFDQWMRVELERWGKLIREQKITLE
jgi:tripartite-type tricarboxylate transporter receptor subunit TctC